MFTPADDMNETRAKILNWFLDKGIAIVALVGFCYLLWTQQIQASQRAELCNNKMIELYQSQTAQLVGVLTEIQKKLPDAEPATVRKRK